ncbi:hypothetical protein VTJ83DRAFT_5337 [Remersonia thermophila]|uniref:Uncharacterized protein n=1 Tax=Remersonia thermophila TaxID=72144 RepID=A0ABR4D6M6_9PEZI
MTWTPDKVASLLSGVNDETPCEKLRELLSAIREPDEPDLDSLAGLVEKLADGARNVLEGSPRRLRAVGPCALGRARHGAAAPPQQASPSSPRQCLRRLRRTGLASSPRARCAPSSCRFSQTRPPTHSSPLPSPRRSTSAWTTPAQEQASEQGLSTLLVDIISGERLEACEGFLGHIMSLLELLCNQDSEPKVANPKTPLHLLALATSDRYDADLDSFLEICTPALAYLTYQDLQPVVLQDGGIELLQRAFQQLYTRFDMADLGSDAAQQLKQVGDAFLSVFADVSALPGFADTCRLDGRVAETLLGWLSLSPEPSLAPLPTAACLVLGNLGRSDEASTALRSRVLGPLADILWRAIPPALAPSLPPAGRASPAPPLQLIHASLGFLKNLAIPAANKPALGASLLEPAAAALLPRLWTSTRTQPQLQFGAVSLTRLLLAGCSLNARRLCAPLPDAGGPDPHPSSLDLLLATAASADDDPIKIEAARSAAQVCRILHSSSPAETLDPSWTWPAAAAAADAARRHPTFRDSLRERPSSKTTRANKKSASSRASTPPTPAASPAPSSCCSRTRASPRSAPRPSSLWP